MKKELIQEILEKLKDGSLSEYYVEKENFLDFRVELVKRNDFKNFRGIGQRGGDVIYQYLNTPRS
jgi:hypothetical protein